MKINKPLAIDLFCGAGGMSEGIIQAGFHIIYSNEINSDAALTYSKRHEDLGLIHGKNTYLEVEDIRNISGYEIIEKISNLSDIKGKNIEIDAIFGGPPCQGFSRAGKQETNDIRNTLFQEYLRIINEVRPKYIIFENVVGIQDVEFKNYISLFDDEIYKAKTALDIIRSELDKIGYNHKMKILNAANFGVPQNRNRLIILGYRDECIEPNFPDEDETLVTLDDAISDLINGKVSSEYQRESINGRTPSFIDNKTIKEIRQLNNEKTKHKGYIKDRFKLLNVGESNLQLKKRVLENGIDLTDYNDLLVYMENKLNKNKEDIIYIFKNKFFSEDELNILLTRKMSRIKLDPSKQSSTVMTLPDDIICPYTNRIFSVREMARIQSFDDSFIFYGKRTTGSSLRRNEVPQYTQVGNAVPPLLAKNIASEIIKVLK